MDILLLQYELKIYFKMSLLSSMYLIQNNTFIITYKCCLETYFFSSVSNLSRVLIESSGYFRVVYYYLEFLSLLLS